jgi:phytanoyl-CoA hydroxylase
MVSTLIQSAQVTENHFTSVELRQFHRDGFVVVRGLADPIEVEQIIAVTDEALRRRTPPIEYETEVGYPGAPTSFNAIGGLTPRRFKQAICRSPVLFEWATCDKIAYRLYQLLGSTPVLSLAHHNAIMVKDPHFSSDTGWHRDIRYWRFANPDLITTQLALTPATLENGCLRFIPGSHKALIHPEQLDQAEFLQPDLPENTALIAQEISIPLHPGDVVFFHALTFHAAGRNRSTAARKSVLFTYHAKDNFPLPNTRSAAQPELYLRCIA